MIVKVNCESDRIESPDAVASLFVHGALIGTPRAVENPNAQNGITFVLELMYISESVTEFVSDAWDYCEARNQDCIADVIDGAQENLAGPHCSEWLPFDRKLFIE